MKASTSLTSLPSELQNQILRHLSTLDHRSLSQTCSFYFRMLASIIYAEIVLKEDSRSGNSVSAIASSPRAGLVSKIVFKPRDARSLSDEKHDPTIVFSEASQAVLGSLNQFPWLRTFELYIDWDIDEWFEGVGQFKSDSHNLWQISGYGGSGEYEHIQPEEEEPWRTLINSALTIIGNNAPGSLESIILNRLPPITYSVFESDDLRGVLNRIKEFKLVLLGAGGTENDSLVTTLMQSSLINDINEHVLPELHNIEILHIQATNNAIIGEAEYLCEIELSSLEFSRLKSLALDYYIVGSDLADFLVRHFETLESVKLNYCYSEAEWYSFFHTLVSANPQRLVEFQICPEQFAWYSDKLQTVTQGIDSRRRNSIREAEQQLKQAMSTGARTFPRAEVDECYGRPDLQQCSELLEFSKGRSLKEWRALQAIIQRNISADVAI